MAIHKRMGQMTYIDDAGDQHILYPITKKECVEGLPNLEISVGDLSKLETNEKSSLVAAINEARTSGSSDLSNVKNAINEALDAAKKSGEFNGRGIVSIARTSGNGAAGTTDTYTITFSDNTTTTFTVYNGADGAQESGTTVNPPKRGVDYWTEDDIEEIRSYVNDSILGGEW